MIIFAIFTVMLAADGEEFGDKGGVLCFDKVDRGWRAGKVESEGGEKDWCGFIGKWCCGWRSGIIDGVGTERK